LGHCHWPERSTLSVENRYCDNGTTFYIRQGVSMNKAIITGLRNRIEANYAADRATLPSELYAALKGWRMDRATPCVGLLASICRSNVCVTPYESGLVHGHILAALQRNELSDAEGILPYEFVQAHTT
jgi:hypothetical protein